MLLSSALLMGWTLVGMLLSPLLLARRAWPTRHPRLALTVWCLVFVTGVVSVVASLVVVLQLGRDLSPSPASLGPSPDVGLHGSEVLSSLMITGAACLLTAVVGGVGALAVYRAVPVVRARQHARVLVEWARASPVARVVDGVPVHEVDSDHPVARALPGRRPVIIVSTAMRAALTADELTSVLEHERSHLRQRHGLLTQLAALQRSITPGLPSSRALERSVLLLIELAADDRAARRCGPAVAASALDKVGVLDGDAAMALRARRLGPD